MPTDQPPEATDAWAVMIGRAVPGIIVAIIVGGSGVGLGILGFLWQQTVQLAELNKTMTIMCEQWNQTTKDVGDLKERVAQLEAGRSR